MGYRVYKCDECGALVLADGGAFLAHRKARHNHRGYGRSKVMAIIMYREKKYEFRDVPQEKRGEWIKANGVLKPMRGNKLVQDSKSYVREEDLSEKEPEYVYVIN